MEGSRRIRRLPRYVFEAVNRAKAWARNAGPDRIDLGMGTRHRPAPEFVTRLERAIVHSIPKPIAVIVCYPSNPTAYVADLDFYRDLVPFAKKHGILVISDLAYAEVYFDNTPPPSVLQVPGALDI